MGIVPSLKKVFPTVLTETTKQMMRSLIVQDIMSYPVKTIDAGSTMDDAAKLMGRHHVGSLIVMDNDEPAGIVTERDLLTTMIAKGKPLSTPVGNVASTPLMVTDMDVNVYEAANIMTHNKIKRLPLVDENDELRGIITARDLVEAFSK